MDFLKKSRMYEVLGLFVLLIVGVMLISESGHLRHLKFSGYPIEPVAKSTFYFAIFVRVAVEIVQGRYQRGAARFGVTGSEPAWLIEGAMYHVHRHRYRSRRRTRL